MIEQLMVKDYILFDYALLDFSSGMSVITGETGAGKSLLIDAISYLCGERAGNNIIRKGKEKCVLQIVFSRPDKTICDQLEEDGFEIDDNLIVTRTIHANGKSTVKLNMMNTTLSYIRKLMYQLMDIHSQMDTYKIMDEETQLSLLDQYANTKSIKNKVEQAYQQYALDLKNFEKAKNETYSDDELDYVTACINEIQQADIQENELEELQNKIKEASNYQKNLEDVSQAIYILDKENGVLEQVYSLHKIVQKNDNIHIDIQNEYYQLDAICDELKKYKDQLQNENYDLDQLQEREYKIKKLFRKYGGNYHNMMETLSKYLNKVDLILHRQDVFEKLEKKVVQSKKIYDQYALELHNQRINKIDELCHEVEKHCHDLMLEHARFKIDVQAKQPSKNGIDKIEFMASMNPGQPFSSLKKSASGGELSRFMLALKVVFQSESHIETIIFDEIDTGVSGKVALAMGHKMHLLSENYQILCITHLSSVACWADHHFCVTKESSENSTCTHVDELNESESIRELAIMATGNDSKEAIDSAKELKKRVHNG
ncbi:DNA repair protein RecN [Floccifex sp.]|uniref:DNA repair protein RecN n=1 Tax=Floccifex sp. TaxID=2815810 RepID=UPI003F06A76E